MSYGRGNNYKGRKERDTREPSENEGRSGEVIYGRNSVIEAVRSGRSINKIQYCGEMSGSLGMIIAEAKERNIVVVKQTRQKLDELCGNVNHQGVAAFVACADYVDVDEILDYAAEKGEDPFIIVLDEIQDAGNLGAIIRTADAVGAHGIIIPKRRAVPLTGAVAKASSGAVSYVKVARVPNIVSELENLKKKGIWVTGTAADGKTTFYNADFTGPVAIVIGNEAEGMGRLVTEQCDFTVNIPMAGTVSSLNASVAAGVVLYEAFKQRNKTKKP